MDNKVSQYCPNCEAQASALAAAREAFNTIMDRGPERDTKWAGMNARDIARNALAQLNALEG